MEIVLWIIMALVILFIGSVLIGLITSALSVLTAVGGFIIIALLLFFFAPFIFSAIGICFHFIVAAALFIVHALCVCLAFFWNII